MKVLLLCRHGATADPEGQLDLPLSEQGKQDIVNLARRVDNIAKRLGLTIWSSPSKRGKESTEILANLLGNSVVKIEFFDEFWIDGTHHYQESRIKKRIASFEGEALLIMSHAPIAEYPVSLGGNYCPLKTGGSLMVRGKEGWTIPF